MKTDINVVDLMERVTITFKISGKRSLAIRMWIGVRLIRLAAYVLNTQVEIEDSSRS